MSFEELASRAGKAAAEVGREAGKPALEVLIASRRRHRLISSLATASAAVAAVVALVLFLPPSDEQESLAPSTTSNAIDNDNAEGVETARETCPVTLPAGASFTPAPEDPIGPPPFDGTEWFGTNQLRTFLHKEGEVWTNLPMATDGSFTQKTFWWIDGHVSISEPIPDLTVTGEDLNGFSPTFETAKITSGGNPQEGVFVIAGLQIPRQGCWRITAEYEEASVSYVAWVGEE